MTKILPIDTVIMLHNKLGALTARNPLRKLIIEEAATFYGVSSSTIYRLLQKYDKLSTVRRADYNNPRLILVVANLSCAIKLFFSLLP